MPREPREMEDQLTPVSPGELAVALSLAWRAVVGTEPTRPALLTLMSQWALETGWGKSMHRYNLGNIKSVPGDGRSWTFFACDEVIGGRVVQFVPKQSGCRFRAYDSLEEGAEDYLRLLMRRYASAWPAVEAGDPAQFAHRLKLKNYYTASESLYAKNLTSIYRTLDARLPPMIADPYAMTDADRAQADALVSRTIYDAEHAGELDGERVPDTERNS